MTYWILAVIFALAAVNVALVAVGAVQVFASRRHEGKGGRS